MTYRTGPVAAGLKIKLKAELSAMAAGEGAAKGSAHISHYTEVVTRQDILVLSVEATVITQQL